MKYPKEQWLNKPDDIKIRTIEDELELATHNGTTKDDLLMMLRWIFQREQTLLEDLKNNWLCRACTSRIVNKEWSNCPLQNLIDAPEGSCTCNNFEWRGPSIV